jgi:hypothetical protein
MPAIKLATFMQRAYAMEKMTGGSIEKELNAAVFVGTLLARSFGLAAGVGLMFLLAAALFSV